MGEFAFSAGYNGGYTYCEAVTIPEEPEEPEDLDEDYEEVETEDSTFYTSEGDEFTYGEIISAISEAIEQEEMEDNDED